MNILSIQSHVAYGHVGNTSAAFAMQRLGHEVWAINTVQFSNHTGYGSWRGQIHSGESVRELVAGIEDRGVLGACAGVLSGYMGDAAIGAAILDAAQRVKAANPAALYCCDPVIGDVGLGIFVEPGIPEFMRDAAVPAADVIVPNHFELEFLARRRIGTLAEAVAALAHIHALGPTTIMVTSLRLDDTPADALDLLVSGTEGLFRLRTPLLPIAASGAGDAVAALFFAHLMTTRSAAEAMAAAASSVFGLLERTVAAGSREIVLIAAQDEIIAPSHGFRPERVGGPA